MIKKAWEVNVNVIDTEKGKKNFAYILWLLFREWTESVVFDSYDQNLSV